MRPTQTPALPETSSPLRCERAGALADLGDQLEVYLAVRNPRRLAVGRVVLRLRFAPLRCISLRYPIEIVRRPRVLWHL